MKRLLLLNISWLISLVVLAQPGALKKGDKSSKPGEPVAVGDSSIAQSDTTFFREKGSVTTKEKPVLFQTSVNLDYGKLLTTAIGWDEKYEAGVTFLFLNQFLILGEYGMSTLSPENAFKNGEYTSEGNYYRIGGGYLKQLNPKSKLGIGLLYSSSRFDDYGTVLTTSPTESQKDYTSSFERKGLEARWMEVIMTSENRMILRKNVPQAKINNLFGWGFYLRAKFLSSSDHFEPIDIYTIPGYGRAVNTPNLALNLFVKVYVL